MEPTTQLHQGDCRDILKTLPTNSIDSVVTDPPYELGFMGKKWDNTGIAYDTSMWAEVLRVLKPGGHLLAFGGTRTYHRMVVAIEDAGFEIRDSIHWIYGSGFPKSLDVSKAIDKRGGTVPWQADFAAHLRSIKPKDVSAAVINAHIANGSKSNFWGHFIDTTSQPLLPTVDQYRRLSEILPIDTVWNAFFLPEAKREVIGTKTSGIANKGEGPRHTIGASEAVKVDITAPATDAAKQWEGWGTALKPAHEPIVVARKPLNGTVAANVLQHGTGALNINVCRIGTDAGWLYPNGRGGQGWHGRESLNNNLNTPMAANAGRWPANVIHDGSDEVTAMFPDDTHRFFYAAKASRAERNAQNTTTNNHPTVKPITLIRYLLRLVTPPNGTTLDPFAGSGTTLAAAIHENLHAIGIELTPEYHPIIQARIQHAQATRKPIQ
jgi:DNA modification methylase